MSTQNAKKITSNAFVEVLSAENGLVQVLHGTIWVYSGATMPDINNPHTIDGKAYWGHQYTSDGAHEPFHDYGVDEPENLYVLAASEDAIIVVTKY